MIRLFFTVIDSSNNGLNQNSKNILRKLFKVARRTAEIEENLSRMFLSTTLESIHPEIYAYSQFPIVAVILTEVTL